jgi:hypothetical protein
MEGVALVWFRGWLVKSSMITITHWNQRLSLLSPCNGTGLAETSVVAPERVHQRLSNAFSDGHWLLPAPVPANGCS